MINSRAREPTNFFYVIVANSFTKLVKLIFQSQRQRHLLSGQRNSGNVDIADLEGAEPLQQGRGLLLDDVDADIVSSITCIGKSSSFSLAVAVSCRPS
jgi:hypothetical protein